MSGIDAAFLVITGGIASEFEDLGGEVFKDGSEVYWKRSVNEGC
jgi:hypothetical protein